METGDVPASGAKPALRPVAQIDDVRIQAPRDEVVFLAKTPSGVTLTRRTATKTTTGG